MIERSTVTIWEEDNEQGRCALPAAAERGERPDPEVVEKATRRHLTAAYKLQLLEAVDRCQPGEVGGLLRREGLYSSHLTNWRRQRRAGELSALAPRKRGRPAQSDPVQRRLAELERENRRLAHRLEQAETIIDVQKNFPDCWRFPRHQPRAMARIPLDTDATCGPQGCLCGPGAGQVHGVPTVASTGSEASSRPKATTADSEQPGAGTSPGGPALQPIPGPAPAEVYATLLDEGTYLCSARPMYRLLKGRGQSRERRDILTHPAYRKPELLGPEKWTCFSLYVLLDIFSRYVAGWMVATRESAELAQQLIRETWRKEGVLPGQLTIHADRGSAMVAKPVALLLADLSVAESHSRPHTSDDNPFSEAQLKTLKYHPGFPDRFGSLQDARTFCRKFFPWYNDEHHHDGLAMLTPAMVHHGRPEEVMAARRTVLQTAYAAHPQRFARTPIPEKPPTAVWINPPPPSIPSAL